jgi:hypothetical protein
VLNFDANVDGDTVEVSDMGEAFIVLSRVDEMEQEHTIGLGYADLVAIVSHFKERYGSEVASLLEAA